MNENQKILTALMLPAFIFVGVNGFTPPADGVPPSVTGWFAVAAVYVALSILLGPRKHSLHSSFLAVHRGHRHAPSRRRGLIGSENR
jgi:hypothetical protein